MNMLRSINTLSLPTLVANIIIGAQKGMHLQLTKKLFSLPHFHKLKSATMASSKLQYYHTLIIYNCKAEMF